MPKITSPLRLTAASIAAAAMIAACGSNSPSSASSSAQLTQTQRQQEQRDAVRFASCMRSHGVPNFPDPTVAPVAFKNALGQAIKSPEGQTGVAVCQHLLPGGRVGTGSQSSANSPAQATALLEFAHCLRSHGFANFPDPNSSGAITHEMLAADGINLRQPGLLAAADTCVSATHGVLTKADVARFAAGN